MRAALRALLFEIRAARTARRAAGAFRALRDRQGLKVHIGAGDDIRLGWVNIDLALRIPPQIDPAAHPDTLFINYDLRRGLPLATGSCDYIYSSHFLEHLEFADARALMRDCHRALRPGGTFRAGLPNMKATFRAYLDGDESYFDLVNIREARPDIAPGGEMLVDYVNYGVYQGGEHKCIYDEEKAVQLLEEIGFATVAAVDFEEGVDPPSPLRRRYSFYVQAVK